MFNWWHFAKAGSCDKPVSINDADQAEAVIAVPAEGEVGDTIHIICEVTDKGEPPLTRYQRVIITVVE